MKLMVTDMGESNKHKVLVEYALRFIKDSVGEELSYLSKPILMMDDRFLN